MDSVIQPSKNRCLVLILFFCLDISMKSAKMSCRDAQGKSCETYHSIQSPLISPKVLSRKAEIPSSMFSDLTFWFKSHLITPLDGF